MRKKLVVLVLTMTMVFSCIAVAGAASESPAEIRFNPAHVAQGFDSAIFVNTSGTDFFILPSNVEMALGSIIPGDQTKIYDALSFTGNYGSWYYVKDEYFPGLKVCLLQAAQDMCGAK